MKKTRRASKPSWAKSLATKRDLQRVRDEILRALIHTRRLADVEPAEDGAP